jgi:hypothetical protein
MAIGKLTLISRPEKLKAGFGAAGMAAVGMEAIAPRVLGVATGSTAGNTVAIVSRHNQCDCRWLFHRSVR